MVVKLFQQLVTESTDRVPATQPLLYSASLKPVIESPYLVHSTVDFGVGRQQVSTNMASTDRLQSLLITQTSLPAIQPWFYQNRLQSDYCNNWLQSLPATYRLYSLASPKPVTESTHLVHSTLLILGQVDVEASTKNCFNQLVMESTDQVPGYTALF